MRRYPTTLIIAGSDCSGGAGIQADLKTCTALGVYGCAVITAVTAQNTLGVRGVQPVTPDMVAAQIEAVLDDMNVDSIKIGMLCNASIAEAVAESLSRYPSVPVILDPVMVSTSGHKLMEIPAVRIIKEKLFPLSEVVTPNIDEATLLTGIAIHSAEDMPAAAERLLAEGCKSVLLKGGHLPGSEAVDTLYVRNSAPRKYVSEYCMTRNTHGTGCTLSSAIAAYMAKGMLLSDAVGQAKQYISQAIIAGADIVAGQGHGALNHAFAPQPLIADKEE